MAIKSINHEYKISGSSVKTFDANCKINRNGTELFAGGDGLFNLEDNKGNKVTVGTWGQISNNTDTNGMSGSANKLNGLYASSNFGSIMRYR